ncbi:hypothetical protein ET475_16830 [Microbacterium protaetiae]|uniref:Uncharacterized protein n=1 Tax=Microbacterium protaetiae TaxID=2509458 RepID=A0A4P6EGN3_9MICO|nr:hypothetical protein [Microbacterium protaetiae]QAY61465.1 hypothetical protein ET475_16830 [Microbacterium protaetiae]
MAERLIFPDAYAAADLLTFSGRASRAGDGAVHLRAAGGTLLVSAAPLVRQGLLDATPTILGLRVLPIDPELECDLVVEGVTLQGAPGEPSAVQLPDSAVEAPLWAQAPIPRGDWRDVGELDAAALSARGQWGMSAVAHALPIDPGEEVVRMVRGRVWSEPDDDLAGLPRGIAFAALTLGFLAERDEPARLRANGRWTRLTLRRGHVLWRGPAHVGMTEVRATGEAAAR